VRIVVSTLAAALGISKIPVMQALRRLETEGFVRINPHKDIVVTNPSPQEYRESYLLVASLERLCMREGANKITPRSSSNSGGTEATHRPGPTVSPPLLERGSASEDAPDPPESLGSGRVLPHDRQRPTRGFAKEALEEHEAFLRALEARAFVRAAKILERHHLSSLKRLDETLRTLTR
jgi:DNA-binding GntR family transcriptional regulator